MRSVVCFSFVLLFLWYKIVSAQNGQFKVVCYYPNWAFYRADPGKYTPESIDPALCTHINYAFAVLDPNSLTIQIQDSYVDIQQQGYAKVTALRKQGIKVLISMGGWIDSTDKYSRLLNDPNARRNFVTTTVQFLQQYGFDGLDLDMEYPGCWQGACRPGSPDRNGFTQLLSELSNTFKPLGLLLTAAVSTDQSVINNAYDIPQVSQFLDYINVMTYDYHSSFGGQTGYNAPLSSNDNANVRFSINYWMQAGAPANKIVVGIPSYGQSFTLADPNNNGVGAPTTGPGIPGPVTKAAGALAYYEICDKTHNNGWQVVRDSALETYAFQGNQWVSYDDLENVRAKAKLIKVMGLGGGMMWSLDFDDFHGNFGCGKYPLLTTLNQELRGVGGDPVNNYT